MAAASKSLLLLSVGAELECPVCLKMILDPPVHVCENGHLLCFTCHEDLKDSDRSCPVCEGTLTGDRNLFVEQVLAKLPQKKCKYLGCHFQTASGDRLRDHEAACL